MKKINKFLCFCLATVFLFVNSQIGEVDAEFLLNDTVESQESIDNTVNNIYSKLHFYTGNESYTTIDSANELTAATEQVYANYGSSSAYSLNNNYTGNGGETLQMTVQFASDFMETKEYLEYKSDKKNVKSITELRALKKEFNAYSKIYHRELVERNLPLLNNIDYDNYNIVNYAPFVVLNISADNIQTNTLFDLCSSPNIEHISINYEIIAETSEFEYPTSLTATLNRALEGMNAYDIINSGDYDCGGIYIGVYEVGLHDASNEYLADLDITTRTGAWTTGMDVAFISRCEEHATKVLGILAEMAPNASFYCASLYQYPGNYGIDWFIDETVDVVNCSFGQYANILTDDGTYLALNNCYNQAVDGLYDYQIEAHDMIVVVAAGNKNTSNTSSSYNPNNEVTSPGYAYNAITVGGLAANQRNVSGTNEIYYTHDDDASYYTADEGDIVKPNVAAPYTITIPNMGSFSGTSASAPLVTGCIAILIEASSYDYAWEPEMVLANITATSRETDDYEATVGNFDAKVGAGMIDLEQMIHNRVREINQTVQPNTAAGSKVIDLTKYFGAGLNVDIGLAWAAEVTKNNTTYITNLTNYNLIVYNSNNEVVASSTLSYSNVEKVSFNSGNGDTFRICVILNQAALTTVQEELSLVYTDTVVN
ncbi:MAG: S8 family serine peptidase [Clostridia bacterium]|nr:S8 family serine peptidase [Clostridia bacterium]